MPKICEKNYLSIMSMFYTVKLLKTIANECYDGTYQYRMGDCSMSVFSVNPF